MGRHSAAAAKYVPDYCEQHLAHTRRCERMPKAEAAAMAAGGTAVMATGVLDSLAAAA